MKVIEPGHCYELESMEGTNPQKIQFIKKEVKIFPAKDPNDLGEQKFVTIQDGTTNEEVMSVMIDRLKTLDQKLPSQENKKAIFHLTEALGWMEQRIAKRKAQNVYNTPLPHIE